MSGIVVKGFGAVSPAGWGAEALLNACRRGESAPFKEVACPGYKNPLKARFVPVASPKSAFTAHPRLRRTSPIAQFAVGAALEALGPDTPLIQNGARRLGIVYCSTSGCVNFSRRFYDETLKDASTASPVIFPETVFNAPSSHLGALLGSQGINYTIVGDQGTFLQGLALAADWLEADRVESCLVIGAEELDWLIAEAFDLFHRNKPISEGAGALHLAKRAPGGPAVNLQAVTQPQFFSTRADRRAAAERARKELGPQAEGDLLCDGIQGVPRLDRDEQQAWSGWGGERWSPKALLGEGFMAGAAWQCVAAVAALSSGLCDNATVSVLGFNQQAIAARFGKS
ncbi:MAG TPA: hypothetical protein VKY92_01245 [Verrucomicrobiae bacterium]|nr:hypothetical protein [Verrucomicrobiae bacterium]